MAAIARIGRKMGGSLLGGQIRRAGWTLTPTMTFAIVP